MKWIIIQRQWWSENKEFLQYILVFGCFYKVSWLIVVDDDDDDCDGPMLLVILAVDLFPETQVKKKGSSVSSSSSSSTSSSSRPWDDFTVTTGCNYHQGWGGMKGGRELKVRVGSRKCND